ncbi:hypothetical protein [Phreatobacter sp. AB_2022a]|uniref:hypothetical protein n=1 Tax=Phreatobacter sp. AB_2022a TaxID=3003134 RepID=UPI0022871C59|nr:hypothetical protein [Phreatobacter sp. AB_2022a]MCZ0733225.1 hypothetical protein [Phreatobacter sp. AB_2022a]
MITANRNMLEPAINACLPKPEVVPPHRSSSDRHNELKAVSGAAAPSIVSMERSRRKRHACGGGTKTGHPCQMCSITPQGRFWFQAGRWKNASAALAAAILAVTLCRSESAKTIRYIAESFKHFLDHFT